VKKPLIILLSFFLIFNINSNIFADEIEEETDYVWLKEEIKNVSINPMKEPDLNSRYVCAFDRSSKEIIFGKDENKRVPMASTTKIMTAIILMENLERSGLTLSTEIEVCKEAGNIGGSRLGLKEGDKTTVKDLLYGLMLCSRK
jgi:D-alanyl-D-alanine carboxypeptidase (penicillin-binding protein 5/6)